jgi:hypothetical protein
VDEDSKKQWLSFIDPKGLHHISLNHPKMKLYQEVKTIQEQLGDPGLILNAFIVTETRLKDMVNVSLEQKELEDRHVLFMLAGGPVYLKKLFEGIILE